MVSGVVEGDAEGGVVLKDVGDWLSGGLGLGFGFGRRGGLFGGFGC